MQIVGVTSETDEVPLSLELMVEANGSFPSILLEAIDNVAPAANEKATAKG